MFSIFFRWADFPPETYPLSCSSSLSPNTEQWMNGCSAAVQGVDSWQHEQATSWARCHAQDCPAGLPAQGARDSSAGDSAQLLSGEVPKGVLISTLHCTCMSQSPQTRACCRSCSSPEQSGPCQELLLGLFVSI